MSLTKEEVLKVNYPKMEKSPTVHKKMPNIPYIFSITFVIGF